jgi:hypothetical protein
MLNYDERRLLPRDDNPDTWRRLNMLMQQDDFRASLVVDQRNGKFFREPLLPISSSSNVFPKENTNSIGNPPPPIETTSPTWSRSGSFRKMRASSDVRMDILTREMNDMQVEITSLSKKCSKYDRMLMIQRKLITGFCEHEIQKSEL